MLEKTVEPTIQVASNNGVVLLKLKPDGSYELPAPIDQMLISDHPLVRAFGKALWDAKQGKLK
jgi:hypothetical protein